MCGLRLLTPPSAARTPPQRTSVRRKLIHSVGLSRQIAMLSTVAKATQAR